MGSVRLHSHTAVVNPVPRSMRFAGQHRYSPSLPPGLLEIWSLAISIFTFSLFGGSPLCLLSIGTSALCTPCLPRYHSVRAPLQLIACAQRRHLTLSLICSSLSRFLFHSKHIQPSSDTNANGAHRNWRESYYVDELWGTDNRRRRHTLANCPRSVNYGIHAKT